MLISSTLPLTIPVAPAISPDRLVQDPPAVTVVESTNKCATPSADSRGIGGEDSAIIFTHAHANSPETAQPNAGIEPISSNGPVSNNTDLLNPLLEPKDLEGGTNNDVAMNNATSGVLPSPKPRKDDDLPLWLDKMISYLRGIAPDTAWQDLVTEFVEFEKRGPQNGVSPFPSNFFLSFETNQM